MSESGHMFLELGRRSERKIQDPHHHHVFACSMQPTPLLYFKYYTHHPPTKMVRSILRNIQNALVLGSVALCILGFQRLESLDVVHSSNTQKASPSSLWPYPPPYTERFSEDGSMDSSDASGKEWFKIGPKHYEIHFFKKEIRLGLFRLIVPTVKETATLAWKEQHHHYHQSKTHLRTTKKKGATPVVTNKKEESRWQEPVTAIVVVVESCDETTIDAALVLKQSLPSSSGIRLHAIVSSDERVDCVDKLNGFEIVMPSNVLKPLCLANKDLAFLIAHTLDADVAVYVPLPSLVVPMVESFSLSNNGSIQAMDENNVERREQKEDPPNDISSMDASSVLMIRPQGKEAILKLKDSIEEYCSGEKQSSVLFSVKGLTPWRPCTGVANNETRCPITNSVSVATFRDCPMPWIVKTETSITVECRHLRQEWQQAREAVRSNQTKIGIQAA